VNPFTQVLSAEFRNNTPDLRVFRKSLDRVYDLGDDSPTGVGHALSIVMALDLRQTLYEPKTFFGFA
jgi:hypothetical protein